MAALCSVTVVVEASMESGSLITAKLALDYNKTVCAVPGSMFSKQSEGCNYLIKQGAVPITSGKDVREVLGIIDDIKNTSQTSLFTNLSKDQLYLVELLSNPTTKNDLIEQSGWPAYKVQIVLMELEIKGVVKEHYGQVRLNNFV